MGQDEKPAAGPGSLLPIPTYEEATSSRPSSSQSYLGPAEISDDAERQGLLGRNDSRVPAPTRRPDGYRPPTVESARSSVDFLSDSSDGGRSARQSAEALRREISQLDVDDSQALGARGRAGGSSLSKRIGSLRLSSFRLPFPRWLPSFTSVRARLAEFPNPFKPANGILLIRFIALLFVLSLGYLVFFTGVFRRRGADGQSFPAASVRSFVRERINSTKIMENLQHATQWDHMAGTEGSFYLAKWIEEEMAADGFDRVALERFDVYLNYPKKGGRRVAIIDPPEQRWEAKIEEEEVYRGRQQTMVFHGYSKSGNVTGPLIYANYGSREDFKKLKEMGISVKNAIILVRYYGSQGDRALKVKAAEQAGAAGCIIYSDPKEDGFLKGKTYPEGRFRPEDSVQRGSVSLSSWVMGDPLSPGFASLPGEPRRKPKANNSALNSIPSIPLAWRDAQPLLKALKGHGKKLSDDWVGGVPEVEWWTGDHKSPVVNLANEQDEVDRHPIYNVLGVIDGREQRENPIIVGNHYDSWCFGSVDPGSGTAVLVEMMRVFGNLKREGWRPLRTIVFAAWDGEEYNMLGSTEYVEARQDELRRNAFAYVNVDVAVSGDDFTASASPVYEEAVTEVLRMVRDPKKGETLFDLWKSNKSKIGGLGAGSDHVAFQNIVGVSSLDLTFSGPQFPYHSCYESFDWMFRLGDPGFVYHQLMGQVWALMVLQLADEPLLPFSLEAYARAVNGYVTDLEKYASAQTKPDSKTSLNLKPLKDAAAKFAQKAKGLREWGDAWKRTVATNGYFESSTLTKQRLDHNRKVAKFEADLLDVNGGVSSLSSPSTIMELLASDLPLQLPGREQFKHVILAPQAWSGYDEAYFPGARDAIDAGDWKAAQEQVNKIGRILMAASEKL